MSDARAAVRLSAVFQQLWAVGIALVWLWTGFSKLAWVLLPAGGPRRAPQWIDQFPLPVLLAAAAVEIALGFALCAGFHRRGLLAGILLLSLFCTALVLWPPGPHQPCGCFGSAGALAGLETASPAARNFFFASMHLFALALLPCARPGVTSPPERQSRTRA